MEIPWSWFISEAIYLALHLLQSIISNIWGKFGHVEYILYMYRKSLLNFRSSKFIINVEHVLNYSYKVILV